MNKYHYFNTIRTNSKFTLIPLLLLILNIFFIKDLGPVYLSCFDPAYNYLLNGLNLASGNLEIGHFDHPGTPVQLLSALIIRVIYAFNSDSSIVESVLSKPETYLSAITYILIFLNLTVLFWLGKTVYKITHSANQAIFLQLTPLVSLVSIFFMSTVGCESSLLLLTMLMVLYAFKLTYSQSEDKSSKILIPFSLVGAFLITVKISSAPVLLLPLFILSGKVNKLKYIGLTLSFSTIILIPIYDKLGYFFNFILGMFTHLGSYGQGQKGLIDFHQYFGNLLKALGTEFPFTISYFIILMASILTLSRHKWFKKVSPNQKRLLYAISLIMSLQLIVVSRQYSFHYLLPAYTLAILGLYAVYRILAPNIKFITKIKKKYWGFSLIFVVILLIIRQIVDFNFNPELQNPSLKTLGFIKNYTSTPRIIMAERHKESAFQEQAFLFGTSYSGNMKEKYHEYLSKAFPVSYFYSPDGETRSWNRNYMKEELMAQFPEILLYAKYNTIEQRDLFLSQFLDLRLNDRLYECKQIFKNPESHEIIYLLKSDTGAIKSLIKPKLSILCNMEDLSVDSSCFVDQTHQFEFEKAILRVSENHLSGNYSVKLSPEMPFGCDFKLKVKPGDFLRVKVWRFPVFEGSVIAASANAGQFYRADQAKIGKSPSGWEQIELAFYIPNNIDNQDIKIYLWNYGNQDAYFDDLSFELF